ncbi:MAG: hypothetical protein H7066_19950, partial [Cytophagaceae bacterium]|nr:hypothetical protein [Gemmatimonadaceae bacterium]
MSTLHPPTERLAELVDGTPTLFEREHVTACARCTKELESYRRLVSLANDERRRIAPPITTWGLLSEELREQGLITTREQATARTVFSARVTSIAWRTAAGIGILVAGLVSGRMTAGMPWRAALALADSDPSSGAQVAMTA